MAKVNLKKFGYERVFVSYNGASVTLVNGQEQTNEGLVAAYPQYFDKGETPSPVEAPKEELLLETPSQVEVVVEAEDKTLEALEAAEDAAEVAVESYKKSKNKK